VARVAAARSLLAAEDGRHLEDALAEFAPPTGPDRDLAWFLSYGVLRRRGHVDASLRAVVAQPLASLDPGVRTALRLGAFEILYARTPPHAVVHQAVELVRALGAGRAHGLVNAVVRRVRPIESLSLPDRLDHPAWLVSRWVDRYGPEATERWCLANGEPPPLFLVSKTDDATLPPSARPVTVGGAALARVHLAESGGPIPLQPGFATGDWWVQDLASVMVADLVGDAHGARVLDACAAPGGKTFRLVSRGARVTAVDRSSARLELLRASAQRLGLQVDLVAHDWLGASLHTNAVYDAVIVDAPCTGIGTVRRHPEIRWRRTEVDLHSAAAVQRQVLDAASVHVRPEGVLVYAVCSSEPEEGEQVIEGFLTEHRRFAVEARLTTAPPTQGEDAHYAVRLRAER
jgi:16S rRNA (cytosine967-C5)-methyltransferase